MQCIMTRDSYKIWHDGERYAISKYDAPQPTHCAYSSIEVVLEQKRLHPEMAMSIVRSLMPIETRVHTPKGTGTIIYHEIYTKGRPRYGVKLDTPWKVFPHLDPCFWKDEVSPLEDGRVNHAH